MAASRHLNVTYGKSFEWIKIARMSRAHTLEFDNVRVRERLDDRGLSPYALSDSEAKASLRTVQRMLKNGRGSSKKVLRLLKKAGFAIDEIPSLIRSGMTPQRQEMGFIKLQMLESLFFAGQIERVREEVKKVRNSDKNDDQADYLDAEIAKWVGDFAKAKSLFVRLTSSADAQLRKRGTAGLIRIADQQGSYDDETTRALVGSLDSKRSQKDKSANPYASLVASMKAWASQRNASLPTALRGLQKALDLARRGSSRIEPVQRLIERASMLRKRLIDPSESSETKGDQCVEAEAAYVEAYANAFACNSMVYMASAINGLARITEHEATIAERNGKTSRRNEKLNESERLLEVAVKLAETSEHAGIIAITVGCLAIVKRRQGKFEQAIQLSMQSIALERKMGRTREAEVDRQNIDLANARNCKIVPRT